MSSKKSSPAQHKPSEGVVVYGTNMQPDVAITINTKGANLLSMFKSEVEQPINQKRKVPVQMTNKNTKPITFVNATKDTAVGSVKNKAIGVSTSIVNAVSNAFKQLGVAPRKGQSEVVQDVIKQFIDHGKKDVVLCAPTGTGKSIIGAATAIAMRELTDSKLSGLLLTATNVLASQYEATFSDYKQGFMTLAGASNYGCATLDYLQNGKRVISILKGTEDKKHTADMCIRGNTSNIIEEAAVEANCGTCEYAASRKMMNSADIVSTNYAMYFVDCLYAMKLEPRALTVFDEAHMLNDLYCTFTEVDVSAKWIKDLLNTVAGFKHTFNDAVTAVKKALLKIEDGQVSEDNYKQFFESFADTCVEMANGVRRLYIGARQEGNTGEKFFKIAQVLDRKASNITKLLEGEKGDHVYGVDEYDQKHYIKTVLVGKDSEQFNTSEYRLFMSATITKEFIAQTLAVSEDSIAFIKMASSFPAANKKVVFYKPMVLNYNTLKKDTVVAELSQNVSNIVKIHVSNGHRGLILTPSFSVQEKLVSAIKKACPNTTLIVQEKGMKQQDALTLFLKTKGVCVLISPSMYEGVDLAGDLSRFQVIVKTPFPALGDARIRKISDDYPEMYKGITLMKLIQGAGRSVRSDTDHAITYLTDSSSVGLMMGKTNVWKDEFTYYSEK